MKRKRLTKSEEVDKDTSLEKSENACTEPEKSTKYTPWICEHGKAKRLCIPCGGSGLCKEHGKIKAFCKECGGMF